MEDKRRPRRKRPEDRKAEPRRRPAARRKPEGEKRAAREAIRESQKDRITREPAPEPVFTPAEPVQGKKILLGLLSVLAVVLALSFALSIFFKVGTIQVSGTENYTPWMVAEASGIQEGDSLFSFGVAKASGRIIKQLPYVKNVRIGIKLPDTVNIEIKEQDVVYAIQSVAGDWWLMNSAGRLMEQVDKATAYRQGRILGVVVDSPVAGATALPADPIAATVEETEPLTDAAGETLPQPVTVAASSRLEAALTIVKQLEKNNEIGTMASVDVSDMGNILLEYGNRFEVEFGDQSRLAYKTDCMVSAIAQMDSYQGGILDVSFTIWPEEVGYTPYL